jgi:hypothetical protein
MQRVCGCFGACECRAEYANSAGGVADGVPRVRDAPRSRATVPRKCLRLQKQLCAFCFCMQKRPIGDSCKLHSRHQRQHRRSSQDGTPVMKRLSFGDNGLVVLLRQRRLARGRSQRHPIADCVPHTIELPQRGGGCRLAAEFICWRFECVFRLA